jgi:hypothetical protein
MCEVYHIHSKFGICMISVKQNNLKLVLVVRRNTRLSRTLQEMEKSGEIIIRGKFR